MWARLLARSSEYEALKAAHDCGLNEVAARASSVLNVVGSRRNAARWSVGLACGLGQGEVLGLRWPYVNLDSGELRVWFQLQRLPWRHGCPDVGACAEHPHRRPRPRRCPKARRKSGRRQPASPPTIPGSARQAAPGTLQPAPTARATVWSSGKSRNGAARLSPCRPELVAVLKAQREAQDLERETAANLWHDHGVVLACEDGRLIDPSADLREWSAILAQAGIPHAGTHTMRHSAATIALDEGIAPAVVQEMLGHSDIRLTRGYTHVSSLLA